MLHFAQFKGSRFLPWESIVDFKDENSGDFEKASLAKLANHD